MEYFVAKSYQEWSKETEPYKVNGKMYVKVRKPGGTVRQVRAYTEAEYNKMYGNESSTGEATKPQAHVVKNILGFQEGYIWIFKGDLEGAEYWFERTPECRFHTVFGWYIVSTETIPFDIPSCIESVQLPWEKVGNTDGTLLPIGIITAAVDELRFGGHPSQFQGNVGERMELKLWLTRTIDLGETRYGSKQLYIFQDENSNEFTWSTGVKKDWSVSDTLIVRGTVKAHNTYQGVRQTELTRVMEVKK